MGCQMNVSDSERVATKLVSDGYEITEDISLADVVLIKEELERLREQVENVE